ncbi:hypothetical protein [Halalkalicoccus salilacus]|uniref:hypothetical protein n=1 Tax=Halalkalicoccus sp. GCM10025704 TaxID=3252662 RepID=UPI0036170AAB
MSSDSRTRPTDDDEERTCSTPAASASASWPPSRGTLHVETDPGITDEIKAALGWADAEGARSVDESEIERITDDAVHLASSGGVTDAGTETGATEAGAGAGTSGPGGRSRKPSRRPARRASNPRPRPHAPGPMPALIPERRRTSAPTLATRRWMTRAR